MLWHNVLNFNFRQREANQEMCNTLQRRHNEHDGVPDHQPHDCILNRLFRRRSKKTSNLRVTGLCARNSPVTGEFPAQRASNAENVSIWWRHHELIYLTIRNRWAALKWSQFNKYLMILINLPSYKLVINDISFFVQYNKTPRSQLARTTQSMKYVSIFR